MNTVTCREAERTQAFYNSARVPNQAYCSQRPPKAIAQRTPAAAGDMAITMDTGSEDIGTSATSCMSMASEKMFDELKV